MTQRVTPAEGKILLKLARQAIERQLGHSFSQQPLDEKALSKSVFNKHLGTFVTLHKKSGELRGCIGNITPGKTVREGVQDNAGHAAFNDTRFNPLQTNELDNIVIEVSILTQPEPVLYQKTDELLSHLRPGVDGVIVKKGNHQATFLPQVWQQLPDKHEFLNHLCAKAGLVKDAWETGDIEVLTYEVLVFTENTE